MFVSNFELKATISYNSNRLAHHKLAFSGCHLVDGHFNVSSMKCTFNRQIVNPSVSIVFM